MQDAQRRTTPLSSFEPRQEIRKLNRLDPDRANFDSILRTYNTIFVGLGMVVATTGSTEILYRARVMSNGQRPSLFNDLFAPPPNLITGYQRCNRPGQSVFYASSRRMTALLECRVKVGDMAYLGQWMCKGPFPVNRYLEAKDNWEGHLTPQGEALLSHFDTLFTRRVDATFSNDYKFTAAISEFLTSGLPSGEELDIRADKNVALRYPSVVSYDGSYNTAMSDGMARERLDLLHVMELRILDVKDNAVRVSVLDNGFGRKNGSIEWTGVASSIPMPRDPRGVIFIHQGGGEWNITVRDGDVTAEEVDAILRE